MKSLNEVFTSLTARRRYEVWFLRLGLADGSGAWWVRYLLVNPGRSGCGVDSRARPVQVWATWFPAGGKAQTVIQGFGMESLQLSGRGKSPFRLRIGSNEIGEDFCRGDVAADGHRIAWELGYRSTFRVTMSDKGWIGFSRSPHSDAAFSGHITLDGRRFEGNPLGFGVQGHNCGYKHRDFWKWTHAYFPGSGGAASTLEALAYDMPLGLTFRKAVLWHEGKAYVIRGLREVKTDRENLQWEFEGAAGGGLEIEVAVDGGEGIHRLPYLKTDCTGDFEVANNSLARARLRIQSKDGRVEELRAPHGGVVEFGGLA